MRHACGFQACVLPTRLCTDNSCSSRYTCPAAHPHLCPPLPLRPLKLRLLQLSLQLCQLRRILLVLLPHLACLPLGGLPRLHRLPLSLLEHCCCLHRPSLRLGGGRCFSRAGCRQLFL